MATQSATGGVEDVEDGMMDGSFHSPEWHAARLASLQTSHTITWEEYKRRQKEEAKRKEEQEDDEVRLMREYRAQLDAERAQKLARGINHANKRSSRKGRKDKDKDKKKKSKSEKKRRHVSDSGSDSEISTEDEKQRLGKKERKKSKRDKKDKRHKSHRKSSPSTDKGTSCDEKEHGPVPLSFYFDGCQS